MVAEPKDAAELGRTSGAGICIPLPGAAELVDQWRRDHDWTYSCGLPAHVTVRMPFPSDIEIDPQTVAPVLSEYFPLDIVLAHVENREGALVILVEPDSRLRSVTSAIGDRCPALPPHRLGQDFVYHVTVVRTADQTLRNEVATTLESQLPWTVRGTELWRFDWSERDLSVVWKIGT